MCAEVKAMSYTRIMSKIGKGFTTNEEEGEMCAEVKAMSYTRIMSKIGKGFTMSPPIQ